jgi:DNA processing protein
MENFPFHKHFYLIICHKCNKTVEMDLRMISEPENRARLAVYLSKGVGRKAFLQMMSLAGSAVDLLSFSSAQQQHWGIPRGWQANWQQADQQLEWSTRSPEQHRLLWWDDEYYPRPLEQIDDLPPVLWSRGDVSLLSAPQVAMVGSRNATTGGNRIAMEFAQGLAESGLCVTSGLAGGIDAAAHQGALAAHQGQTIAVVGTGVDLVYPARNKALAEAIVASGLMISEFPLGARAEHWHFPQRNRIISGLSLGVLVVEAAEASGSLITAGLALEQGREVFAIPGSIHNPLAKGCHALIKKGQAKLTETVQDILTELAPQLRRFVQSTTTAEVELAQLSPTALALLKQIPYDPISADELMVNCQLSASEFASLLMELEISDSVENYGGNRIARIR